MWKRPTGRNTLGNRLAASVWLTVALMLLTATFFVVGFAWTVEDAAVKTDRVHQLREAAARFGSATRALDAEAFGVIAGGGTQEIDQYIEARKALDAVTPDLTAAAADDVRMQSIVHKVIHTTDAWRTGFGDPLIESARRGADVDVAAAEDGERYEIAMIAALDELDTALRERRQVVAQDIAATSKALIAAVLTGSLAMVITLLVGGMWLFRSIGSPLGRLNRTAEALVAGQAVTFQAEHDDEIGALALILERFRIDAAMRLEVVQQEASQAAMINHLAELMSFAQDEGDFVKAAIQTLARVVPSLGGDILLINASQNRLAVAAAWGDPERVIGELVAIDRIDRCPGIRRASPYLVANIAEDVKVRCPAHPAVAGSLLCVPMPALGAMIGVIHLANPEPDAFSANQVRVAVRVAEQVALAIANARLMSTMEGLAMTDSLTGLHNSRFFDPYLEQELAAAERDQTSLAVIMVDLDHFKRFNDTHGHPAGDEALKAFAHALRTSIRVSDVVARYGGEEFIVCARQASVQDARSLAEKIRIAVEQTVVELGPGRFARITASFGVAGTSDRRLDRQALIRAADEALYQAKTAGRNRVEIAGTSDPPSASTTPPSVGMDMIEMLPGPTVPVV